MTSLVKFHSPVFRLISKHHQFIRSLSETQTYIVTQNTACLEQEKQACYLTNTIMQDGLPPMFEKSQLNMDPEHRCQLVDSVRKSVVETHFFHRDEPVDITKRTTVRKRAWKVMQFNWKLATPLLFNLMRITMTSEAIHNSGLKDTTISYRPDVRAPWTRHNEPLQITGRHGQLFCGRKLMPPLAEQDFIESTRHMNVDWDDLITPFFDLHKISSICEPRTGFHDGAPFPCPQKIVSVSNFKWSKKVSVGHGIFYCFAHSLTHALKVQGAKMGEDLLHPIPMQFIGFNGTSFYFVWFQLNTLKLDPTEHSLKNIAWAHEEKLFTMVTDKFKIMKLPEEPDDYISYTGTRTSLVDYDRKVLAKTSKNEQTAKVAIEDFNRNAAEMYFDFMMYPLNPLPQ